MNKQGLVPIWARITVDGHRAEFSTQKQVLPEHWDGRIHCEEGMQRHIGLSTNSYPLQSRDHSSLQHSSFNKEVVTADDVRDSYRGIKESKKFLRPIWSVHLEPQ